MAMTDAQKEEILDLWAEGLSAAEIARKVGTASRSAVCAHVARSRANGDPRAETRSRPKPKPRPARGASARRAQRPTPNYSPAEKRMTAMQRIEAFRGEVSLGDIGPRQCRYIGGNGLCCGKPTPSPGAAWCADHHARVYCGRTRLEEA